MTSLGGTLNLYERLWRLVLFVRGFLALFEAGGDNAATLDPNRA